MDNLFPLFQMLHRHSIVILLVTCTCFLIQAQSEVYQIAEKKNTRVYCGSTLSDMLSMVCQGRYNTKFHKKSSYGKCFVWLADDSSVLSSWLPNTGCVCLAIESDSDEDYGYVQQQQPYLDETMMQFPYRTRANAASLISGTFRRYTRGIIDECCRKPCSIKEMRSYCAPDV